MTAITGFFKLFHRQLFEIDEQTKILIEKDIEDAKKPIPSFKTIINADSGDKHHSKISINLRGYYDALVTNLRKMEKPYLQFLQSYP